MKNVHEGELLRRWLRDNGITQEDFAGKLDMTRQNLGVYMRKEKLPANFKELIQVKGFSFNVNQNITNVTPRKSSGTPNAVIASAEDYYTMMVPLVNKFAYAGYLSGYGDDEYIERLPTTPLLVEKAHKGNYMAFEVRGDSMDNGMLGSLPEGFIAYGREIPRDLWRDKLHLRKWRNFIVVTKTEGILIKQITNHDPSTGIITLHSLNPEYTDIEMHLDNVLKLFNVVRFLGE